MLIFYKVETVNQELLKAVQKRQLPDEEARQLRQQMQKKREVNLRVLFACAAMILLAVFLAFTYKRFHYPDALLMFGIIGLFVAFFVAIFRINALVVAQTYLKALRDTYPELFREMPSTVLAEPRAQEYYAKQYAWRQTKLTRRDAQLLESLANGQEPEDKARVLYKLAREKRKQCLISMVGGAVAAAVLTAMFWPYPKLHQMAEWFCLLVAFVLLVNAFFIYWTYRYMKAIRKGYPQSL
ncbi:hypothetical protein FACS1894158_09610 [Betaproteobacteria bacterium]|nr:hypothetical protein FACS1894158_09610 [Betaproteobacteria bacterium]